MDSIKKASKGKNKAKPRGKPIEPGQVLNPKGRPPKGYSLAEITREYLEADDPELGKERVKVTLDVAYTLARQGDMKAIETLWSRGWGKPVESVKLEADITQKEAPKSTLDAMLNLGFTESGFTPHREADWSDN